MAFGGLFKKGTQTPSGSYRMKIIQIIYNEQEGDKSKGTKCN